MLLFPLLNLLPAIIDSTSQNGNEAGIWLWSSGESRAEKTYSSKTYVRNVCMGVCEGMRTRGLMACLSVNLWMITCIVFDIVVRQTVDKDQSLSLITVFSSQLAHLTRSPKYHWSCFHPILKQRCDQTPVMLTTCCVTQASLSLNQQGDWGGKQSKGKSCIDSIKYLFVDLCC